MKYFSDYEYDDFAAKHLPFDDLNVLIEWNVIRNGNSYFLDIVIYQPRHRRLNELKIHILKADFEKWMHYMERYICYDVHRDGLIYIEHKYGQMWVNLTWDEAIKMNKD